MLRAASLAAISLLLAGPALAQPVVVTRPPYPAQTMARAQALMANNDTSGARRLLERAANQGAAEAATALGRTFDPIELGKIHSTIAADPDKAAEWYAKAIELGDPSAAPLLQALKERK